MWRVLAINLYFSLHPVLVRSAWVEIPQVPSRQPAEMPPLRKPTQFVLGAPKVSFVDHPTTPANHRLTPKMPVTSVAKYEDVMTGTVSPLTTVATSHFEDTTPKMKSRTEQPQTLRNERPSTYRTAQPSSHRTPSYRTEQPPTHRSHNTQEPPTYKAQQPQFSSTEKPTPKPKNTYSGFLPLLQSIQQTLTINAKKSLKSKISLLSELRDNLLANIDERMSSLWKRSGDSSEARGHDDSEMDFPSNEGALMTIGFLTFAVFLIKLVLKLIHALKYKQINPTVVTTVAPAVAFVGRKKRELEDDGLQILRFIEEYNFS